MRFIYNICLLLLGLFSFFSVQAQDPCTGVSCSNKGSCIINSAYSRGYWCECDSGWAGQDCKHPEPTVRCGDSEIDVVIDKGLVQELEIDDDAKYVYFGRSSAARSCRAVEEDNLYKLSIKAPFSNCGTQVIQRGPGDDYTFSNTVVWNREVHKQQNLIDRELILLDFKCIYEDSYTVSGPSILPTLNVLQLATERGKFEVRMRLYDDNSFSRSHEFSDSPTIMIGTNVYVQVELAHIKDTNLVVTMDRCFASQSRDPLDPLSTKHMLISDRCADDHDTTVQIQYNGELNEGRFKFQMFKWRWSADDVYIHCEVDICNTTFEQCTGDGIDCKGSGGFRRKRSMFVDGVPETNTIPRVGKIISNGPIHVQVEESFMNYSRKDEEHDYDTPMMILGILLAVVLTAVGLIIIVMVKRRGTDDKKPESKLVPEQRLTSLRFTREAF